MQHTFFQKLALVILAAAVTAGIFEFYKGVIVGSMDAVNGSYSTANHKVTPAPTPRRY